MAKDKLLQRAAAQRHYAKNKEAIKARAAVHRTAKREAIKTFLRGLKESQPCTDCGQFYPYYVMDYDHVGHGKVCNVANMIRRAVTLQRVREEIAKCELVCANCHRRRTHTC